MDIPSLIRPLWTLTLQPASWRGVPFVLTDTEPTGGRRVVVHEYPYRDPPIWAEDIGPAPLRIPIDGYLNGDDVYVQRDAMRKQCAIPGPGTLVHPSLGSLQVVLLQSTFGEKLEDGRTVHLQMLFIQSGNVQYPGLSPSVTTDTAKAATKAADGNFLSSVTDFLSKTGAEIQSGFAEVAAALGPVLQYAGLAIAAVSIASAALSAVRGLGGAAGSNQSFGRYNGNLGSAPNPVLTSLSATGSPQTLVAAATTAAISARTTNLTTVSAAGTAAATASAGLNGASEAFCASVFALTEAARSAIVDPGDQISALAPLCSYTAPATAPGSSPINAGAAIVATATAAVARRAALTSMASATAAYQPTSSTATAAIVTQVAALFDTEITTAADAGDLNSYQSMRATRTAVVRDLTLRGAALPALITVNRMVSLPSLVLAYQLYQDASRSDDLIARANPANPAFMPLSFTALSA